MGGSAFANAYAEGKPSLRVRRIQVGEYQSLVQTWLSKVQSFFDCSADMVQSPIPAPEKVSFGDIDIVVGTTENFDWSRLATEIGATALIKRGPKACSIAVLAHGDANVSEAAFYTDCNGVKSKLAEVKSEEEYIQVDINLVEPHLLAWTCFADAYGDNASILGYIISRFGFTQNDRGFWLRVKELDDSKSVPHLTISERDGMILLTDSPEKFMEFLGLSILHFKKGFETMSEYFHWLSQCRLLFPELLLDKQKTAEQVRRERKRPIYADFFFEWLPKHPEACINHSCAGEYETIDAVRADLLQPTLEFFRVSKEYELARLRVLKKWHHETAVHLLRELLKSVTERDGVYVALVLRGMRRHVVFVDDQQFIDPEPHHDKESQLSSFLDSSKQQLRSVDELRSWLSDYHSELRSLGKVKHKPNTTAI